jgi:hypothetical protein
MSTSLKSTILPFRILDFVHDNMIDLASYFAGKLNEYNEVLAGKIIFDPNDPFNMETEHILFIESVKESGKYENLIAFAREYETVPYHMRRRYLHRFFTLNFT